MVADSVHVFTLFPFLPETAATLEEIGQWSRHLLPLHFVSCPE
jgi:salicylate hydroxylase